MSPVRFQWRPRTNLLVWLGFWMALFVSTHIPVPDTGPFTIGRFDKLIHFGLFSVLTWLAARYFDSTGRSSVRTLLVWAMIFTAYAALDEWLQQFVGRSMTLGDWVADTLGVATATLGLCVLARRISEPAAGEQTGSAK